MIKNIIMYSGSVPTLRFDIKNFQQILEAHKKNKSDFLGVQFRDAIAQIIILKKGTYQAERTLEFVNKDTQTYTGEGVAGIVLQNIRERIAIGAYYQPDKQEKSNIKRIYNSELCHENIRKKASLIKINALYLSTLRNIGAIDEYTLKKAIQSHRPENKKWKEPSAYCDWVMENNFSFVLFKDGKIVSKQIGTNPFIDIHTQAVNEMNSMIARILINCREGFLFRKVFDEVCVTQDKERELLKTISDYKYSVQLRKAKINRIQPLGNMVETVRFSHWSETKTMVRIKRKSKKKNQKPAKKKEKIKKGRTKREHEYFNKAQDGLTLDRLNSFKEIIKRQDYICEDYLQT